MSPPPEFPNSPSLAKLKTDLASKIADLATSEETNLDPLQAIDAVAGTLVTMITTAAQFGYNPRNLFEAVVKQMAYYFGLLQPSKSDDDNPSQSIH